MELKSPEEIGTNFARGMAIGENIQRTALDAAQIRAGQQQLQEQMKPVKLEDFTKAVPDFLRPHVVSLAESQGIIEKNGDMAYVRGGNARSFIEQFKSNRVWQATVYDQANQSLQKELSPLQEQYMVHKDRWTNLMQNYKDQYEQAVDAQGRPDQIKRNQIEAKIAKEEQTNNDYIGMNKLGKNISELSGRRMKALQVLGVIDEGFKKDEVKYGPEDAIRLNTGLVTRQQLDEQQYRMAARAKADEIRQTKMLEASLLDKSKLLSPEEEAQQIRIKKSGMRDGASGGGKAPIGYRYTNGGDLEPIPGGPADIKFQNEYSKATAKYDELTSSMDELRLQAEALSKHRGLSGITGMPGMIPNRPGSAAANAQTTLDSFKSKTGLTTLANLKSGTGAGLGQVTEAEHKLLQNFLSALDTAQSTAAMQKSLKDIIVWSDKAKARIDKAYKNTPYGKNSGQNSKNSGQNIPKEAISDLMNDPSTAPQFDEIFGEGASKRYLGR